MTIDARGWVAVAELIVFIPCAIASFIICRRHGFTRASGWVYTLILCIIRIAGSICQLLTYSDESTGLITAVVILDSIGLSPLLFATLGMLSRLTDQITIYSKTGSFFKISHFRLLQLFILLGLVLNIVGADSSTSGSTGGAPQPAGTSEAGIILYIVAFLALMLVLFISFGKLGDVPQVERRVAFGVLCAAPFLLVRLAYTVLAVFLHDYDFNIIDGSVTIYVVMRVLEEFIVVFIYIFLGYHLDTLTAEQSGPIATRAWKDRGRRGGRRGQAATSYAPAPQSNQQELRGYPPQTHQQRHAEV